MNEEKKAVEATNEDLEKVNGGDYAPRFEPKFDPYYKALIQNTCFNPSCSHFLLEQSVESSVTCCPYCGQPW